MLRFREAVDHDELSLEKPQTHFFYLYIYIYIYCLKYEKNRQIKCLLWYNNTSRMLKTINCLFTNQNMILQSFSVGWKFLLSIKCILLVFRKNAMDMHKYPLLIDSSFANMHSCTLLNWWRSHIVEPPQEIPWHVKKNT